MIPKNILVTIVLLASIALMVWLMVLPIYDGVSALVAEINTVTAEIEGKNALYGAIDKVLVVLEENRKKIEIVTDYVIPKEPHMEEIAVVVDYLAKQNSVLMDNLSFSAASGQARAAPSTQENASGATVGAFLPTEISVNGNITGTYENIKGFLQSLERSLRIYDIQSLSVAVNQSDLYTAAFAAKTYSQ
jgi:hypothetical protein